MRKNSFSCLRLLLGNFLLSICKRTFNIVMLKLVVIFDSSEHYRSCLYILQVVQEYERAVIFRLGRLAKGGAKGPGNWKTRNERLRHQN